MSTRKDIQEALKAAFPIMLGYVAIGIPCGVMENEIGIGPFFAFFISCTFYSGAGQFMMSPLILAGTPLASIALSIGLVSSRQMLYSAAFSPFFASVRKRLSVLFAATVTDESFGVNMERYSSDGAWDERRATLVNIFSMLSWATSNALGSALGAAVDLPLDVMSFGMTSIFACLLVSQLAGTTAVVVCTVSFIAVALLKLVGMGGIAVFAGALAGIIAGLVFEEVASHAGA